MNTVKLQDKILLYRNMLHFHTKSNNELPEWELSSKQPQHIKNNKIIRNKFNQGSERLFEICKDLMKETEDDTNEWEDILCLWIEKINIVQMAIPPKAIYRYNPSPNKILMTFFMELEKNNSKIYMDPKLPPSNPRNLEKKGWRWRYQAPCPYHKTAVTETAWYRNKNRHIDL